MITSFVLDWKFLMKESKESRDKKVKLLKKSTGIILIGLVILTGLSLYVISLSPTMKEMVEKDRPVERKTLVDLFLLQQVSKREFTPIDGKVKHDSKIAFNLSSNVPVHVALLMSVFQQTPEILFIDAKIPPGENKHLEKAGNRFLYPTSEGQGRIKFCLVQADTSKELFTKLSRVKNVWLRLPDSQCAEVDII